MIHYSIKNSMNNFEMKINKCSLKNHSIDGSKKLPTGW